jgi:hypothetical protein
MLPISFFVKINTLSFMRTKIAQNILSTSEIYKKLSKENNRPIGGKFAQSGHPDANPPFVFGWVCWSVPDCSDHEPQVLTQESDTDCLWAG